jgi:hypothetical protein
MLMNANANRPRQQRQLVLLGILIAVLVGVVAYQLMPESTPYAPPANPNDPRAQLNAANAASATPSRSQARPGARGGSATKGSNGNAAVKGGVEEVNLAKLEQPEPKPIEGHRNPFSLAPEPKPASAAASSKPATEVAVAPPPVPTGPPPVPPPPPITLKFFGVVTAGRVGKLAALGDGKFVYHGREGEIIEGRYRIVRIGEESIQLEYVDGRGRQTIRLSGK